MKISLLLNPDQVEGLIDDLRKCRTLGAGSVIVIGATDEETFNELNAEYQKYLDGDDSNMFRRNLGDVLVVAPTYFTFGFKKSVSEMLEGAERWEED